MTLTGFTQNQPHDPVSTSLLCALRTHSVLFLVVLQASRRRELEMTAEKGVKIVRGVATVGGIQTE